VTEYASVTSSPVASRVSDLTTTVTPEDRWRMPMGVEVVVSVIPGSMGLWKWKSCSPWRIAPISSPGITDMAAMPIAWKAGTIENTGGASSPAACWGIASFVAAA
jgi:hypothetical protein